MLGRVKSSRTTAYYAYPRYELICGKKPLDAWEQSCMKIEKLHKRSSSALWVVFMPNSAAAFCNFPMRCICMSLPAKQGSDICTLSSSINRPIDVCNTDVCQQDPSSWLPDNQQSDACVWNIQQNWFLRTVIWCLGIVFQPCLIVDAVTCLLHRWSNCIGTNLPISILSTAMDPEEPQTHERELQRIQTLF